MDPNIDLSTFPTYLQFAGTALLLFVLGVIIYELITPIKEFKEIANGNLAAAAGFAGFVIGYGIVINSVASSTHDVIELAVWSAIGLVGQLLAFGVAWALTGRKLITNINNGTISSGVFLGAVSIVFGLINGGALSY